MNETLLRHAPAPNNAVITVADLPMSAPPTVMSLKPAWPQRDRSDYLVADAAVIVSVLILALATCYLLSRRPVVGLLYGIAGAVAAAGLVYVIDASVWRWFQQENAVVEFLDNAPIFPDGSLGWIEATDRLWLQDALNILNRTGPAIEPVLWAAALALLGALAVFVIGVVACRQKTIRYLLAAPWETPPDAIRTMSEADLRRFTVENRGLAEILKRETNRLRQAGKGTA